MDNPKHELPSLVTCLRAGRIAYQRGWLPHISADWLIDDGAMAALALLGLAPGSTGDGLSSPDRTILGPVSEDKEIRRHIRDVRWRRVDRVKAAQLASEALLSFVEDQRGFDFSDRVAIRRAVGDLLRHKATTGNEHRPDRLVALLVKLDHQLARDDAEVRWEVRNSSLVDLIDLDGDLLCEPKLVFRRDLRRLIAQLEREPFESEVGSSCRHVAECIAVMSVGISWIDVARAISGDRFFESVECGQIEFDENTRWVTPTCGDGDFALQPRCEVDDHAERLEGFSVWLQARTDPSGNAADFRVPEGEEAERLREALAQIWHNG